MYIPTFIYSKVSQDDGNWTADQQSYQALLNQQLQNGLSDNGWTLPQVTMAELTAILAITTPMANGTLWWVTDHVPPCVAVMTDNTGPTVMQFDLSVYP